MTTQLTILDHLNFIQKNLVVKKTRYNKFQGYHYRNCEDILEELNKIKPAGCAITLYDEVRVIGDRHYVIATATFLYLRDTVMVNGWAREPLENKGQSVQQVTATTSSYARKLALNGLFAIDDNDDVTEVDNQDHRQLPPEVKPELKLINSQEEFKLSQMIFETKTNMPEFLKYYKIDKIAHLTKEQYGNALEKIKQKYATV